MWILLPLIFIGGFSSGRDVDLVRRPMTLTALALTIVMALVLYLSMPSGCPGGTCVADGFLLIPILGVVAGVLGYLAGGLICSIEESRTPTDSAKRND